MKILYVEDEISISNLAKIIFMRTNHEFMVCPKLKETKSILEGNNIGLVILDMTFPTFSGLDILEHISSRKINTSVIIYSGCISQYSSKLQSYINSGIILKVYEKPINNFEEIISFIDEIK